LPEGADALALVRREQRELDALLGEQLKRVRVGRGLSQPHAFRRSAVVVFVVGDAPADLRDAVAAAGERQDHVVVDLRHGRAVAAVAFAAAALAVKHHAVGAGRVFLEAS
jgi:hypothetical protein